MMLIDVDIARDTEWYNIPTISRLNIQPSNIAKRFDTSIDVCEVMLGNDSMVTKPSKIIFFVFLMNMTLKHRMSVEFSRGLNDDN